MSTVAEIANEKYSLMKAGKGLNFKEKSMKYLVRFLNRTSR